MSSTVRQDMHGQSFRQICLKTMRLLQQSDVSLVLPASTAIAPDFSLTRASSDPNVELQFEPEAQIARQVFQIFGILRVHDTQVSSSAGCQKN